MECGNKIQSFKLSVVTCTWIFPKTQIQQRLQSETRLKLTEFLLKMYRETHMIMSHYSAERQTAKQTLTTSKNSIEFTYSNFPCHLKVNRDKLALINRLWKCKKGERLTITAYSCTKIDQLNGFHLLLLENSARLRNQSDC